MTSTDVSLDTPPRCDSCGHEIDGDLHILEVPEHGIADMRLVDEPIADELERNDGHLALHPECRHPVEQYHPEGDSI